MDDDIVYSAPLSKSDEELEKGFVTAIIDQPKLLDELAKQLVTLGLAIPGLYATVLKFIGGDDVVAKSAGLIIGAFVFWFIALVLSLFSLRPRKWTVDRSKLRSFALRMSRRWCLRRLASGGRAAMSCLKCRMTGDSVSLPTSFTTSGRTLSISAVTATSLKIT